MPIELTVKQIKGLYKTPNGVYYDYGVTVRGGYFVLFTLSWDTPEKIKQAKAYLRQNRDVLSIRIEKVKLID